MTNPSIAQKIAKNSLYGRLKNQPPRATQLLQLAEDNVVVFEMTFLTNNEILDWMRFNVTEGKYSYMYDRIVFDNADDAMLCYMRFS